MGLVSLATSQVHGQADSHDHWAEQMRAINSGIDAPFEIDEQLVAAAGIRKISGKHLDLYTDVRDPAVVDELPAVFDLAVKQWCNYFGIGNAKAENWKLRGFLIADRNDPSRFQKAGLMPDDLPTFLAGFQRRQNLWFYLQPGEYYTRHLMIHEGTHGFMLWYLGGYGAPWFGEGMAELFGAHQWKDRQLTLRYRLRDRSEAPYWGRVKRIKDEYKSGDAMTLDEVILISPTAFLNVRNYGWSWAACNFLANHEKSKSKFEKLIDYTKLDSTAFNRRMRRSLNSDWDELSRDWELYLGEIEYGFEVARAQVSDAESVVVENRPDVSGFKIKSDRSWQTTTLAVRKGERYQVSGKGEFIIAKFSDAGAQPWTSQSNGITIKYHRGHPLGMLHAGILDPSAATAKEQVKGLLNPVPIGLAAEFTASQDGILCLRINESPAALDDNEGGLEVTVEKLK